MCAPMLGVAASVAGSVVGAIGGAAQADAQAAARERQAQVREINAITRREQGAARADAKGDEHDGAIAAQDAAAAANGVLSGSGSAAKIARKSYQNKYLDIANILHTHESEAVNEENLAKSDRAAADDIRKAGKINAFGTILGGLASASKGVATQIA